MFILQNLAANETNEVKETKIEDIYVTTATKTQKNIDGVSASVVVITEKDIEKMGAESLKDVIKNTSGINLQSSSKSKSKVSIRGMGADGTLFLIDGRRLAGEVQNPYDLDRIPASSIERIEIVKGPMSSLYGADATGGIINIITKKPTSTPEINLGVRYGQNKDGDAKNKNASFSVRGKADKIGYSIYANQTNTTPYTQKELSNQSAKLEDITYREKSEISTVGGRLYFDITDSTSIGLDVNYFDEEREGTDMSSFIRKGTTTQQQSTPVNFLDKNKRIELGLDLETAITDDLSLKLRANQSKYKKRKNISAENWSALGYSSENDSKKRAPANANVDVNSFELITTYALNDSHLFVAGVEYRTEDREATLFRSDNQWSKQDVDYKSIYLQDEWQLTNSLSAILGARYDDISNVDSKATFKVGVTNQFSNLLNARILFAQGYRAPNIAELYVDSTAKGALVTGYNLKPEFSNTYEIGLGGRNNAFSYDIALFLNEIEDKIALTAVGSTRTYRNVNKARTQGLELNLAYDILDNLLTNLNYTYLDTEDRKTKKDLEYSPENMASLSLSYQPIKSINITPSVRYIGEQYYTENNIDKKANSQTLVDLTMDYKINKNFTVYGGVNNIFNEKVDDILGSDVGTYYFAGLRAKF